MRAAIIARPGDAAAIGEFAEPPATEGRDVVSLVASGIHPIVRSMAAGTHYGSHGQWPMVAGVDAVARTADGTLIYTGFPEPPFGTIAERIAVPTRMRFALPAGADPVQVAAGMNPGLSSWLPLTERAAQVSGLGTVLILGVTGTAGLLAVQNAFAHGADRVVGLGRDAARLELAAQRGAITLALTGDPTADARGIAAVLGDAAPSTVLDFVWGTPAEAAFAALSRAGLDEDGADIVYVEIGALSGAEAAVPASLLRSRRIRIVGSGAGSGSLEEVMRQLPIYLRLIADGTVVVPVRQFRLSDVGRAWEASAQAGVRVVVTADDPTDERSLATDGRGKATDRVNLATDERGKRRIA